MVNDQDGRCWLKFHWNPKLGVHSLTWDRGAAVGGMDSDSTEGHYDATRAGPSRSGSSASRHARHPEGVLRGFDCSTRRDRPGGARAGSAGREDAVIRTPTNFFAVDRAGAFLPATRAGHRRDEDPMLQVRLFSYIDTQITRLGGPNFSQFTVYRRSRRSSTCYGTVPPGRRARGSGRPSSELAGRRVPFFAATTEHAFVTCRSWWRVDQGGGNPVNFDDNFGRSQAVWATCRGREGAHSSRLQLRARHVLRAGRSWMRQLQCWQTSTGGSARRWQGPRPARTEPDRAARRGTAQPGAVAVRGSGRPRGGWSGIVVVPTGISTAYASEEAVFAADMVPLLIASAAAWSTS